MKQIRITITATIPEGDKHLGHKAVVATEDAVVAVVAVLEGLGMTAEANRDLVTRREEAPPKPVVKLQETPPSTAWPHGLKDAE